MSLYCYTFQYRSYIKATLIIIRIIRISAVISTTKIYLQELLNFFIRYWCDNWCDNWHFVNYIFTNNPTNHWKNINNELIMSYQPALLCQLKHTLIFYSGSNKAVCVTLLTQLLPELCCPDRGNQTLSLFSLLTWIVLMQMSPWGLFFWKRIMLVSRIAPGAATFPMWLLAVKKYQIQIIQSSCKSM